MFSRKNNDKFANNRVSPELAGSASADDQRKSSINFWLNKITRTQGGKKFNEDRAIFKIVTDRHIINGTTVQDFSTNINTIHTNLTNLGSKPTKEYPNLTKSALALLGEYKDLFALLAPAAPTTLTIDDDKLKTLFAFAKPDSIGAREFERIMVFITAKDPVFFEDFKKKTDAFIATNPNHPLVDRLQGLVRKCQFSADFQADLAIKKHWNKIDTKPEANNDADKNAIRDDVFAMVHDPIIVRSLKPNSSRNQSADNYIILFDELKSKFQERYTIKGKKHEALVNEALDSYHSMYTMLSIMANTRAGNPGAISARSIANLYALKDKIGDTNFEKALKSFFEKFPNIAKSIKEKLAQEAIARDIDRDIAGQADATANYNQFVGILDGSIKIKDKKEELFEEFRKFAKNNNPNGAHALNGINPKLQELVALGVSNEFIINTLKGAFGTFLGTQDDKGKPVLLTDVHFTVLHGNSKIFRDINNLRNFDDIFNETAIFDVSPTATANHATTKIAEIKTHLTKDFLSQGAIYLAIKDNTALGIPDIGDSAHFRNVNDTNGNTARAKWANYIIRLVNLTNVLDLNQIEGILQKDLISKFAVKFNDPTQAKSQLQAVIDLLANPEFFKQIADYATNKDAIDRIALLIGNAAKARQAEVEKEKSLDDLTQAVKDIGNFQGINDFAGVGVGNPSLLQSFGVIADALALDENGTMKLLRDSVGKPDGLPTHDQVKPVVSNDVSERVNKAEQEYIAEAKKLHDQAQEFKKQIDNLIKAAIDQKLEGAPANVADFYTNNYAGKDPFLQKLKDLADFANNFERQAKNAFDQAQIPPNENPADKNTRASNAKNEFDNAVKNFNDAIKAKEDFEKQLQSEIKKLEGLKEELEGLKGKPDQEKFEALKELKAKFEEKSQEELEKEFEEKSPEDLEKELEKTLKETLKETELNLRSIKALSDNSKNITIPAASAIADKLKAAEFADAAQENETAHNSARNNAINATHAQTTGLDSFEITTNNDGTVSVNVCYSSLVQLLLNPTSPSQGDVDKRINALFTVFRSLLLKSDPNLSPEDQNQRFRHLVEKAAKEAIDRAQKDNKEIQFSDGTKKSHKDYLKDHFGGNGVIMMQHLDACGWICEQAGGKGLDPANRHISIDNYTSQSQTVTPVVVYIPKTYGINQEKPQRSIVMERTSIDPNTTVDLCLSADNTSCTFDSTKRELVDYDLGAPVGKVKVKFNSGPTIVTRKDPSSGKTTFDTVFICSTLKANGGTGANRDLKNFQNTALLPIEAGGKKYYVEVTLQTNDGSMPPVVYKRGDFTFRILERQGVAGGVGDVLRTIAVGSGLNGYGLELYSTNNSDISHIQSALDTNYDFNCVFSEHYKTNETGEIRPVEIEDDAAHTVVKPKKLTVKDGTITSTDGVGSKVSSADVHYGTTKAGWTIFGQTPTLVFNAFTIQDTSNGDFYDSQSRGLTDRFLLRNGGRLVNLASLGAVSYFTPEHYNTLFVKKVLKSRGIDQKAFEQIVSEICGRGSEVSNYLGKDKKLNLALSHSNITDLRPLLALQARLGQKDIGAVLGEIDLTGCNQLFQGPYRANNLQVLEMLGVSIAHENSVESLKERILDAEKMLDKKNYIKQQEIVVLEMLDFNKITTLTKHEIRELAMFAIAHKMSPFVNFTKFTKFKNTPYKGSDSIQRILFSINAFVGQNEPVYAIAANSKGRGGKGLGRAIFEVLVNKHREGNTKEVAKQLAEKDFTYKDPAFGNKSIEDELKTLINKCNDDCKNNPDNFKNIQRKFSADVMRMLKERGVVDKHEPDIYTKVASIKRRDKLESLNNDLKAGKGVPEFLFISDMIINKDMLENIKALVQGGLKGLKFEECAFSDVSRNDLDSFHKKMKAHCPEFEMHVNKPRPNPHTHTNDYAPLRGRPTVKGVEEVGKGHT